MHLDRLWSTRVGLGGPGWTRVEPKTDQAVFRCVPLGSAGFRWVLLGSAGFRWVPLGFARSGQVWLGANLQLVAGRHTLAA